MKKEFSRNIGDTVWFMDSNKAVSGYIYGMRYSKITSPVSFKIEENEVYKVKNDLNGLGIKPLNKLFSTKEELLKSL